MIRPTTSRGAALVVLDQVERGGAYASVALDRVLSQQPQMNAAERGLATELVYGVLRHQSRLDHALQPHARKGLNRAHPLVRRVLRLAAFQLLFLDRVPAPAAIHEAVEVVKSTGQKRAGGFVNAVLRRLAERGEPPLPDRAQDPAAYLRDAASLPGWIADALLARMPPAEATALGDALLERPPTTVRANRSRLSAADLAAGLAADDDGLSTRACDFAPEGLHVTGLRDLRRTPRHDDGSLEVQDEGAQLVTHLLGPRPGERILDACAGRGGKTLHIAACVGSTAELVAADRSAGKLEALCRRAERAGFAPPRTVTADLTSANDGLGDARFSRVLLDAPCSGLGVLRRHPEAKWRPGADRLEPLVDLQRRLLDRLAERVAPGGLLAYAVCTVTASEGPDQVQGFLQRHADYRPEPPPEDAGVDWRALLDGDGPAVQTWPHRHGCDGFFMVRLRRHP